MVQTWGRGSAQATGPAASAVSATGWPAAQPPRPSRQEALITAADGAARRGEGRIAGPFKGLKLLEKLMHCPEKQRAEG
jgi:hypothetical protein